MNQLLFYLPAVLITVSAMTVVWTRNPVYGVFALILAFFNGAALCLMLGAELIAMVIIIVYVGAVAVLFLFVVMMLDIDGAIKDARLTQYLPLAALLAAILFLELLFFIQISLSEASVTAIAPSTITNTEALGRVIYTDYMPLFEIAALILLVAMVGAIILMNHHRRRQRQDVMHQTDSARKKSVQLRQVKTGQGLK